MTRSRIWVAVSSRVRVDCVVVKGARPSTYQESDTVSFGGTRRHHERRTAHERTWVAIHDVVAGDGLSVHDHGERILDHGADLAFPRRRRTSPSTASAPAHTPAGGRAPDRRKDRRPAVTARSRGSEREPRYDASEASSAIAIPISDVTEKGVHRYPGRGESRSRSSARRVLLDEIDCRGPALPDQPRIPRAQIVSSRLPEIGDVGEDGATYSLCGTHALGSKTATRFRCCGAGPIVSPVTPPPNDRDVDTLRR